MRRPLLLLSAALTLLAAWSMICHPWGWLYGIGVHPYPASSSTPWTYQALSGFIPALAVLTLLGAVASWWHHINCHKPKCFRKGRHIINGTPWCDLHQAEARPETSDNELLQQILTEISLIREMLRERL